MIMSIKDQVSFENFTDKKDNVMFSNVHSAFTNRGFLEGKDKVERFSLKDLVTSEDLMRFVPRVVETVVREAIEPNLFVADRLFQKVSIERGTKVQIGAIGALEAGRIGQGAEYPQRTLDMGEGDMVALTPEKYGLKISMTEEVVKENQIDIVNLWLRAAGRALARLKEVQAVKLLDDMGYDIFDNVTPTNSYFGVTTGRDITGSANGSMTANDVFDMYAYLLMRNMTPDVLLMHPLAWKTFMTDTEMREVVLNGSTISSVKAPNGQGQGAWGTSHMGYGLASGGTGNAATSGNNVKGSSPWVQTLNPLGATFNIAPSYLPTPIEVIVTHYVPFTAGSFGNERIDSGATTNVIMVDSSACGVIGQQEDATVGRWTDPERDIENIKIKEVYGFGVLEQGKGVAVGRNIAISRNYNFENSNSVTLSTIPANSGILS